MEIYGEFISHLPAPLFINVHITNHAVLCSLGMIYKF